MDDEHFKGTHLFSRASLKKEPELGISVGHRIKLRKAIGDLKQAEFEGFLLLCVLTLNFFAGRQRLEYVCKVIVVGDIGFSPFIASVVYKVFRDRKNKFNSEIHKGYL